MTVYDKTPLSVSEQSQLLLDRGLICTDKARLERYLTSIGYYRLSAYWLPFEQPASNSLSRRNHQFVPGTTFDKILNLYIFDRKLRLLVMEAIERIEVSLRSQWSGLLPKTVPTTPINSLIEFRTVAWPWQTFQIWALVGKSLKPLCVVNP